MPDDTRTAATDLRLLGDDLAREARWYLGAVEQVADVVHDELDIPLVLLALARAQAAGARLGAHADFVPDDRFEADPGPDRDVDALREGLAAALEGVDDYVCVVDQLTDTGLRRGRVSDDLVEIAVALQHGLVHHEAGRLAEALWWWQYSWVSGWGDSAAAAMRTVVALLAHARLDVDDDVAAEAEFEALHPGAGPGRS